MAIHVLVGAAYQLIVAHQPTAGAAGTLLQTQPMLVVADRGGNLVKASALHQYLNVCVSLLPTSNAHRDRNNNVSAATHHTPNCTGEDDRLTGTLQISSQRGKAYFYDLGVMMIGDAWRLQFVAEGLQNAVSEPFAVSQPANASELSGGLTLGLSLLVFDAVEQRALVLVLAAVLGVNTYDVTLTKIVELRVSRRRHLLSEGLEVSFRVVLHNTHQQQRAQELSAGDNFVQAFADALSELDDANLFASNVLHLSAPRILDLKMVVQAPGLDDSERDSWSGFWTWGDRRVSTPAGIIFKESSGDMQMLVGATGAKENQGSSSALSCAGTGNRSLAALVCYSDLGEFVGVASLRKTRGSLGAVEAVATLVSRRHSPVEPVLGAEIVSEIISIPAVGDAGMGRGSVPVVQVVAVSDTREILAASVSLFQVRLNASSGKTSLTKEETLPQSQGVVAVAHLSHFGYEYLMSVSHYSRDLESYALPSVLYRLQMQSATGPRAWLPVQTYTTYGATQVVSFRIDRDVFLAISNYYNGSSHHVMSEVVRFTVVDAQGQYTPLPLLNSNQSIATVGARAVAHFHGAGSPKERDEMLLFTSELTDTIHFLVWDRDAAQFVMCHQLFHVRPTSVAVTTTSSTTHMIGIASALQDVAIFSTAGLGLSRQLVKLQTLATGPGHYLRALTLRVHLIPTAESVRELEDLKCFAHVEYRLQHEASAPRDLSSVFCIMGRDQGSQESELDIFLRLPTRNATSLMSITLDDGSLIVSGNTDQPQNGGGGGLDVYDVRDYSLTREANNLKLVASILPFEDELHINQRYTATVRLRNGEENTFGGGGGASPLFARSACACIMGADGSLGNAMTSTGEGSISSFDAAGFAVFSNVSFTMPCVAQRVVLVNPFLESVSTPPFRVSPPYTPGSAELPALSRLQITQISSISTVVHSPVLESGKPFHVSLRRVNCWGEDAAWPLPPRSITATSLRHELRNAVADDLDPAGVVLDFQNLEIRGSGTNVLLEFSAPGFLPARTSVAVAQSMHWQQPLAQTTTTSSPTAHELLSHVVGASAVSFGAFALIFGGRRGHGLVPRTTVIDADADEVYALNVSGAEPSARWQHAACRTDGSMWVLGGLGPDNSYAGGMFELRVESRKWINWSTTLLQPAAPSRHELGRKFHLACTAEYVVVSTLECHDFLNNSARNYSGEKLWYRSRHPSGTPPAAFESGDSEANCSNMSASVYVMQVPPTASQPTNLSANGSWTRINIFDDAPVPQTGTHSHSSGSLQGHLLNLAAMTSDGTNSQMYSTVSLNGKCARALTFENVSQVWAVS